ncbi:acetyltransferase [Flavobacterium granuli]|uniref:Acetyltransferase EpsM n=1 Tax=Flavobacterium granuli TaxID=280093 RepID=A0ABU1S6U7_9FLAO|nr:acetyltransferase [Flavobacterium granuli]MDR6846405.1 acetyltransferase EpsM [Flavobacterium granuli]
MYLFGGNGHCKVIVDIIKKSNEYTIEGIFDDNPKFNVIFDIPVFKTKDLDFFLDKQLIISIGNNNIRKKFSKKFSATYINAIHPNAIISNDVRINEGTVIMAGAILNASVTIGKHCIINTGAVIEHDCIIHDFVHVSPNSSLAGNVVVGEGTQIGIGASVIQGIQIGKWSTIGAGTVIIDDVPDFAVIVGNPGKIIKYNSIEND